MSVPAGPGVRVPAEIGNGVEEYAGSAAGRRTWRAAARRAVAGRPADVLDERALRDPQDAQPAASGRSWPRARCSDRGRHLLLQVLKCVRASRWYRWLPSATGCSATARAWAGLFRDATTSGT